MSNLTPTHILDKNGKATTVHKNLSGTSKTASRVAGITAAPDKLPVRAIRAIIAEEYPHMDAKRRAEFVTRTMKYITPILEGRTEHFGTPAEAISVHTGRGVESRDRAERIVEAAGTPNDPAGSRPVPYSSKHAWEDGRTRDVINGDAKAIITFDLSGGATDPKRRNAPRRLDGYSEPFYTSQISNRRLRDQEDKPEESISTFYDFEYMGAVEYEFGAIPNMRKGLQEARELQYATHSFTFDGVTRDVHFIGADVAEPIAFLKAEEAKGEGLHLRNKIGSGFNDAFNAGARYNTNSAQTVWWALNGDGRDFMYTLDADRAEDVTKVIRQGADKKQKLVKVDVEFV